MSEEEIKHEINVLKHTRGILKGKITRFRAILNTPTNQTNFSQIEARLKSIKDDQYQFDICQSRLEYLDSNTGEDREQIEYDYFELITKANDFLKQAAKHANT